MKRASHSSKRGFTIVELLIVIVVIAILAAITIVGYNGIQAQTKDARRASDLESIQKALLTYEAINGGLPKTTTYYGSMPPYSGWDSSIDAKWLNFLNANYGKMPIDPTNTAAGTNPPASVTGNKVYYYYCYTNETYNPLGAGNPVVVIGYHKEDGSAVQRQFRVTACL